MHGPLVANLPALSQFPDSRMVSLVLNAGTVHQGTPLPDFPIFAPLHIFFWHFFSKIGIYDLDLA
jgi:hypothetical protein